MFDDPQIAFSSQQDMQIRKLSRAIEQSHSIVIITDFEGSMEYVNPRFCQVTGFTTGEVIGENPRILRSGKTSHDVYQDLWQTISAGREWRGELHNRKKNGDYFWVSTSISPIKDDDGKITHFIGIQEDITDRKRIERENNRLFKAVQNQHERLVMQAQQLRQLTQQVITAQEAERYRVSRELHDVTGQMLTLLKISLETLKADLSATICNHEAVDWPRFQQDLSELISLCEQTMNQIRLLAHDLRPTALDDLGLNMALKALCKDFGRHGQLQIDYTGTDICVPPETIGISLYRILQEALTNVTKHAGADHVEVRLEKDERGIRLFIEDNGRGLTNYTGSLRQNGIGLLSMRERLEALGGYLGVEASSGQGTRLTAFIPH